MKVLYHRELGTAVVHSTAKDSDDREREEGRQEAELRQKGYSDFCKTLHNSAGETHTVFSEEEEAAAREQGFSDSPADHGIETHPAKRGADPKIAAKKQQPKKGQQQQQPKKGE